MEAALDSRIPDGVVNLKKSEHVKVVAENMFDAGIAKESINEFVKKFMDEGKYPERQAFNKDGWLVTFPSKQYRDAALKKGTHSIADPTHGRGGMNLYYKKKGKQQRQTQQDPTQTEPTEVPAQTTVPQPPQLTTPPPAQKVATADTPKTTARAPGEITPDMLGDEPAADTNTEPSESPSESPSSTQSSQLPPSGGKETSPAGNSTATTPEAPAAAPVAPTPPPYAELSKKFATGKGWAPTPYGEWRDKQGNTMAVTGQSGEVVPVQSVYRDELKLVFQKSVSATPAPVAPPA